MLSRKNILRGAVGVAALLAAAAVAQVITNSPSPFLYFTPVMNGNPVTFVAGDDIVGGPSLGGGTFTGSITPNPEASNGILTVLGIGSTLASLPVLSPGTVISGSGITAGTTILSQLPGSVANYIVSVSQTVASETITYSGSINSIQDASYLASPIYASGGCTTTPAIAGNPKAFTFTNGATGCSGNTLTLTMPAAAHKWVCNAHDVTSPTTTMVEQSAAGSTTSVVFTNYTRTTGAVLTWVASDVIIFACNAY